MTGDGRNEPTTAAVGEPSMTFVVVFAAGCIGAVSRTKKQHLGSPDTAPSWALVSWRRITKRSGAGLAPTFTLTVLMIPSRGTKPVRLSFALP